VLRGDDGLRITVSDNDKGLGAANLRGRGLDNMTGRAATIGGELAVAGEAGRVRVVLDLPVGGTA
jgi:signal transduction histidine kinase